MSTHPLGTRARVLLTSVFGPYSQDDEFGSRAINPMELYHNQVTRGQGPFSLRMHHRSWGLMLIKENITAPTTLDRLPDPRALHRGDHLRALRRDRDLVDHRERRQGARDVPPGPRSTRPASTIVVGGHVAAIPGIATLIDADEIVRGEGIRWFRDVSRRAGRPVR